MSIQVDLRDIEVLVLEDDYYLADDARQILEGAGARVIGPFSDAAEAVSVAGERTPSCALVDINLGAGPSFTAAKALLAHGVPIILVTGYDGDSIPPELGEIPRLQKPFDLDKILNAVRSACGR